MSRAVKKQEVYLDNAAATPIDPRVGKEMLRVSGLYGNPSSFNDSGRAARKKIEDSRRIIAGFIGARSSEVIFTSSGSESNSLAILGLAGVHPEGGEIITTPIEHVSVLRSLDILRVGGWKITFLKVDGLGRVNPQDLVEKLNPRVRLVSVMYANNEIGTIQPIKKVAKVIKDFRSSKSDTGEKMYPFFHVDACQASAYLDMNVNNLGVDLLTLNGAKVYGPRGSAILYKREEIKIKPLIYGGSQEHGLRAGTENISAIAGLAKAVSLVNGRKDSARESDLRDYFLGELDKLKFDIRVNGAFGKERLPNSVNFSISGISDERLLLELDKRGVRASSGSACTAHSVEPSHVLKAIGVEKKYLGGALRFSLGRQTKRVDVDFAIKALCGALNSLLEG